MSRAIENPIGGIPAGDDDPAEGRGLSVLAETLHQAGAKQNVWFLPGSQNLYLTDDGRS